MWIYYDWSSYRSLTTNEISFNSITKFPYIAVRRFHVPAIEAALPAGVDGGDGLFVDFYRADLAGRGDASRVEDRPLGLRSARADRHDTQN